MKIINVTAILLLINGFLFGQAVKVIETTKIPIEIINEAYYPHFSKDDTIIIFSSSNYKGLYTLDLNLNSSSIISDLNGAGYNPLILDNQTILYTTIKIINGKKYRSVKSFGLESGIKEILEADKRILKLPSQLPGNLSLLKTSSTKAVYVEDNSLFLINGDETKELNPLGKGVYVWESFSNDGSRLLFSFGNRGAFICDLDGKIIANIEDAHYPKFSPDGKYVSFMKDKDDGYQYTSSDIYVYSIELVKSFPITKTNDKVEMFAEWSNDGKLLVYHTTAGEIYTTTLKCEN